MVLAPARSGSFTSTSRKGACGVLINSFDQPDFIQQRSASTAVIRFILS